MSVHAKPFGVFDAPKIDNFTTNGNDYADVPIHWPDDTSETRTYWPTDKLGGKTLRLSASSNNLKVQILASLDGGANFPIIAESEFTVTTATPVIKVIGEYYHALKIQVKPAVAGSHGTLTVQAAGSTLPSMADISVTALLDKTGLATEATLADVATEATLDYVKTAVEALAAATPDTADGDLASMSADLGTIKTDLATAQDDIALIKADVATSAKQDTGNDSLSSIDGKLAKGDQNKAASLSVTPATDIADGRYIGDIAVKQNKKGTITTAHDAIATPATSTEIDCRGFNSVLVYVTISAAKNWTFSVQGSLESGGTFVNWYELANTGSMAAMSHQCNANKGFTFRGIPDYIKINAAEDEDGATVTVKVQPFNM